MKNIGVVVLASFVILCCCSCGWDKVVRNIIPKQAVGITVLLVKPAESNVEVGKRDSNVVIFCVPTGREAGVKSNNSNARIILEETLFYDDTVDVDPYCNGNKGWYAAMRFLRISPDTGTGVYDIFLKSGDDTTRAAFKIGFPKAP
ncbi:MAG: hypothetical protein AAB617_03215 [Patescibacteria group bacterium]